MKLQRPKGTQDIFPKQQPGSVTVWQHLEELSRELFKSFCYQEIRTPVFEPTELFERGVGDSTDIVNKEMYTFEIGERRLTLRPEGTAGVVRAFIENGLSRSPKPLKLFYFGPMFRYERPQEGRQRQFHQVGVEVFGTESASLDAEVVILAWELLKALNIQGTPVLEVNTVGTAETREQFKAAFKLVVTDELPNLCEDCNRRFQQNPLRMLDCKVPVCKAYYASQPIETFLNSYRFPPEVQQPFEETLKILEECGIPCQKNPRLVRGLDYYTGFVFEISSSHLGAQNALCGGGRYNELVKQLGGEATPAVGWAMGMERLIKLLPMVYEKPLDVYIVTDRHVDAFQLARTLRTEHKLTVEVDTTGKAFGKQLAQASKRQAKFAVIRGEAEAQENSWLVKNLEDGEQAKISEVMIYQALRSLICNISTINSI